MPRSKELGRLDSTAFMWPGSPICRTAGSSRNGTVASGGHRVSATLFLPRTSKRSLLGLSFRGRDTTDYA